MRQEDNLEKFIREQIESIEATEGDRMWKQFQTTYPIPKLNYWGIIGGLVVIVMAMGGYWLFENYKIVPVKNITQQEQTETQQTTFENTINTISTIENKKEQALVNRNVELEKTIEQKEGDITKNIDNQNIREQKSTFLNIQNSTRQEQQSNENKRLLTKKKTGTSNRILSKTKESVLTSEPLLNEAEQTMLSTQESSTLATETSSGRQSVLTETKETLQKNSVMKEEKEEEELIKIMPLQHQSSGVSLPIAALPMVKGEMLKEQSKGPWFVDVQSLSSVNSIRQQHIGIGKAWYGRDGHGVELMVGVQHSDGYSASLDSVRVTRNISITEYRKDKDLNNILDAYFGGLYAFKFRQFQFSLGGKAAYGFYNQYTIQESTRIIHGTNFNVGSGVTTGGIENNDWQALNRWRFHGMLRLGYQWQYWTVGVTASQQVNLLIKNQLAASNKSNNPIQLGVNLRYSF